jgi:hypothetical protein
MNDTQNTSNSEGEEAIALTQEDFQFFGSVLTAMTRQSQFATNAVEQSYIREIDQLREDFIFLYRRIQKIQTVAQRLDLEYVLEDHAYAYQSHQQPGWWSEDFKKNF